jgi:uncharacterized protein (DUF952 family)
MNDLPCSAKNKWETAAKQGFYETDSLKEEGFIHLSKQEQVKGVLQRYYKDQKDLLLLHIDENKLTAELKYELAPSVNELFPHLFGRLNLDAVTGITAFEQ